MKAELIFDAANTRRADLQGSHGFSVFIQLLYDKNPITDADLEVLIDKHSLEYYKKTS
jgi:hypothetical protein